MTFFHIQFDLFCKQTKNKKDMSIVFTSKLKQFKDNKSKINNELKENLLRYH